VDQSRAPVLTGPSGAVAFSRRVAALHACSCPNDQQRLSAKSTNTPETAKPRCVAFRLLGPGDELDTGGFFFFRSINHVSVSFARSRFRAGQGAVRRGDGVTLYDAEGRKIFGGRLAGAIPEADAVAGEMHPFRLSRPVVTASEVVDDVAVAFGLSRAELLSNSRSARVTRPRMAGYWLIRETLKRSYHEIARAFRRENHATILHGCRETEQSLANGGDFAAKVLALRDAITAKKQALAEAASAGARNT